MLLSYKTNLNCQDPKINCITPHEYYAIKDFKNFLSLQRKLQQNSTLKFNVMPLDVTLLHIIAAFMQCNMLCVL